LIPTTLACRVPTRYTSHVFAITARKVHKRLGRFTSVVASLVCIVQHSRPLPLLLSYRYPCWSSRSLFICPTPSCSSVCNVAKVVLTFPLVSVTRPLFVLEAGPFHLLTWRKMHAGLNAYLATLSDWLDVRSCPGLYHMIDYNTEQQRDRGISPSKAWL